MSSPETPPPAGGDPGPGGLSGIQRASIVLGALAVLLIVFVVFRGGDDSGDSPSSSAPQTTSQGTAETTDSQTTATTATGETGSTSTGETGDDSTGTTSGSGDDTTSTTTPEPEIQTVRVVDGKPQGGIKTLSFKKDDQVRFKVQSDTADEIHVHGYDLKKDVSAGGSVQFAFTGDIEGRFEVELENAGVQIANLEVTPS
jgi:cytoskeletal protein RodZ